MVFRVVSLLAACVVICGLTAPSAAGDPEAQPVATDAPPLEVAPESPRKPRPAGSRPGRKPRPVDDGRVASTPPATTTTPDGWVLTVSAKDETQLRFRH